MGGTCMTLEEMKLAVCEKLSELIHNARDGTWTSENGIRKDGIKPIWDESGRLVHWPTEGLQVCHEAERLLTEQGQATYALMLHQPSKRHRSDHLGKDFDVLHATYEQRLDALCRVWYPERFTK